MTTNQDFGVLFAFSEWLDGEGLIRSDGETHDKRSHAELAADFLDERIHDVVQLEYERTDSLLAKFSELCGEVAFDRAGEPDAGPAIFIPALADERLGTPKKIVALVVSR